MSNDTDRLLSKIQQNTATLCTTLQRMQEELLTISQAQLQLIDILQAIQQQGRPIRAARKRRIRGMGPVKRLTDEELAQVSEFWPEFIDWYKNTHDDQGKFVGPDKWLDLLSSKRVVLEEVRE